MKSVDKSKKIFAVQDGDEFVSDMSDVLAILPNPSLKQGDGIDKYFFEEVVDVFEMNKNMAKPKVDLEKRRQQKRDCERRRREKVRSNPEQYEKAKQQERERYYERKKQGKIKLIGEVSRREKKRLRKKWKEYKRSYNTNKKHVTRATQMLKENTPPAAPTRDLNEIENNQDVANVSGRSSAGRKRVLRKRSATVRKLKELERKVEKYKKLTQRYKTRLQRFCSN
ncbi:unnamed protein product [Acanthoscelides obtectus]|uniref:Uncharacterized protein n=1 Tax=Acanthoscelides obtectus TaxID=200917 RepID=A0A9P0M266_ACAOB|nr:unnamed protein product [Acanthoscelides obtectus]CAK1665459.1 hypothetical protein AOBTE_LOCUS24830 [Acanthoscelides obtectus]